MMKCTEEVQKKCPCSILCDPDCEVSDNSECADFIMSVIMGKLEAQEADDAAEAEYLRQERQAIQEEGTE